MIISNGKAIRLAQSITNSGSEGSANVGYQLKHYEAHKGKVKGGVLNDFFFPERANRFHF